MYYAIVDCDNCYASCARVFRPDLRNRPVVVLSNNDGCVVARSNEAKQLGIKGGTPYYQLAKLFPNTPIVAFSSNYELYGDITGRVMALIREAAPDYVRYSIDEAFCLLDGIDEQYLKEWGEQLHRKILHCTGMPVSIGIAPTKTLAKMASHYAKHYPGYRHCCVIDSEEKRLKALKLYPLNEVWGIGRKLTERLEKFGDKTAFDFASHTGEWIKAAFNIVAFRTWAELHGNDCVPNAEMTQKKSIGISRSFNGMIKDKDTLRPHVSKFAVRCSEKLREQNYVASVVGDFIDSNRFRDDLPQYRNSIDRCLLTPSQSTQVIVQAGGLCLDAIYREGYQYKRAGVIVMGISSVQGIQTEFADYDAEKIEKLKKLDAVID